MHGTHELVPRNAAGFQCFPVTKPDGVNGPEEQNGIEAIGNYSSVKGFFLEDNVQALVLKFDVVCFVHQDIPANGLKQCATGCIVQ